MSDDWQGRSKLCPNFVIGMGKDMAVARNRI
jgi:hypothetical protein